MENQIRQIINEVFPDLQEALAAAGEDLDSATLADTVSDRLCDTWSGYTDIPYEQRRAEVLKICQEYV